MTFGKVLQLDDEVSPDLIEISIPLTFAKGDNVVQVGSVSRISDATVSATQHHNALLITDRRLVDIVAHIGHPISVSLGPHVTWKGFILGARDECEDQVIYIDSIGAPVTVQQLCGQVVHIGLELDEADLGKTVHFGSGQPGIGFYTGTVTDLSEYNRLVLDKAIEIDVPASNCALPFAIGTDNFGSLQRALNRILARGIRTAVLDDNILVSKLPAVIGRVFLRGHGKIYNTSGTVDTNPASFLARPVVPFEAPQPEAPERRGLDAAIRSRLANLPNPTIAFVGASTFTIDSGGLGAQTAPVRLIRAAFQISNPHLTFRFREFSLGGAFIQQYSDAGRKPLWSPWDPDQIRPWVGNQTDPGAVFDVRPDAIVFEWSGNDSAIYDVIKWFIHLNAMVDGWPKPPAIFWAVNPNYSLGVAGMDHEAVGNASSRFVASYCQVTGRGLFNFRRELVKARDGFDPNLDIR